MQENLMEKRHGMSNDLSAAERTVLLAMSGLLAICWLCAFCSGLAGSGTEAANFRLLALYVSLTCLILAIVRLVFAREMMKTEWRVSDTSITRISPTRIITVDFSRIIRFRFRHVPLLFSAGWIRHDNGIVFLSFHVRDLAGFITSVRMGIDRSSNPGVYDAPNLDRYVHAAQVIGLRDDRLKRYSLPLFSALILAECVCIATSRYLWHFPLALTFMWSVVALCFFMMTVLSAETLLSFRFREKHPDEALAYFVSGLLMFVIYLCCGILLASISAW
jgi:hypothetical protein